MIQGNFTWESHDGRREIIEGTALPCFVEGENAVADSADKETQAEALSKETQLERRPAALNGRFGRTAILVSLSALILVGLAAAAYAWPNFSSALPSFDSLAELFPRAVASAPVPDSAVSAALKDIHSAQQQTAATLRENEAVLQQDAAMLQQGAAALESLRQSFAVQQTSLKGISNQLSALVARVDALQNATMPLTTSSITVPHARAKMIGASRKRTSRLPKPFGPVSVGGAPLSTAPAPGSGAG